EVVYRLECKVSAGLRPVHPPLVSGSSFVQKYCKRPAHSNDDKIIPTVYLVLFHFSGIAKSLSRLLLERFLRLEKMNPERVFGTLNRRNYCVNVTKFRDTKKPP